MIQDRSKVLRRLAKVLGGAASFREEELYYYNCSIDLHEDLTLWIFTPEFGPMHFATYDPLEYHFIFLLPLWKIV